MTKTNRILAALLILQILIAVVIFWPRSAPASSSGPLFADLTADSIVSLTVQDGEGNQVLLAKEAGRWVLPEAGNYPAQDSRVGELLDKIVALTTGRLVTQTDASHKRLQVAADDFVRRVDFSTADGQAHTLFVGSSPQARATHVRAAGQDEVYLATDLASFDVGNQAVSYLDATYFSVTVADITSMTVENANGTLAFAKDAEGNWTLEGLAAGEELDTTQVSSLANRAAAVRLTQPLGQQPDAAYGLESPQAVVTLVTQSGEAEPQTHTLRIGAQDPVDSSYVVSSSDSPYFVRVAQFSAGDFVTKTRADLLLQPTPAAEGSLETIPLVTPSP